MNTERMMPLLELPEVQHVLWEAVSSQITSLRSLPPKPTRHQLGLPPNRGHRWRVWAPPPQRGDPVPAEGAPPPGAALQSVWERGPDVRHVVEARAQVRAVRQLAAAEIRAHRKARSRRRGPTNPGRDREILRLYRDEGLTLREVGNRYGLSHERIRQIATAQDPGAKETRRRLKAAKRAEQRRRELDRRLADAEPCRICGKPVLRGRNRLTCSPSCADSWRVVRYQLDPEFHKRFRRTQARWILRNPRKHAPGQVSWARSVLTRDKEPNRRFLVPGSRTAQVLKRVAPDVFAERSAPGNMAKEA